MVESSASERKTAELEAHPTPPRITCTDLAFSLCRACGGDSLRCSSASSATKNTVTGVTPFPMNLAKTCGFRAGLPAASRRVRDGGFSIAGPAIDASIGVGQGTGAPSSERHVQSPLAVASLAPDRPLPPPQASRTLRARPAARACVPAVTFLPPASARYLGSCSRHQLVPTWGHMARWGWRW